MEELPNDFDVVVVGTGKRYRISFKLSQNFNIFQGYLSRFWLPPVQD